MAYSLPQKLEAAQLREELCEAHRFLAQLREDFAEKCSVAEVLRIECEQIRSSSGYQISNLQAVISDLRQQLCVKEQECNAAISDSSAKEMELIILRKQIKTMQNTHTEQINALTDKIFAYEQNINQLHQQLLEKSRVNDVKEHIDETSGLSKKNQELSNLELREDVLILNNLNKELEIKTNNQEKEIAELIKRSQALELERAKAVLEKDIQEAFYHEKVERLTKAMDTASAEKSRLQEMYDKMTTEHYNATLQCTILATKLQEKERTLPQVATIVKQVCLHNSHGDEQRSKESKENENECHKALAGPVIPQIRLANFHNYSSTSYGVSPHLAIFPSAKPHGTKVKTQAGNSFVPETKRLLGL